jgi:hypothetical protein
MFLSRHGGYHYPDQIDRWEARDSNLFARGTLRSPGTLRVIVRLLRERKEFVWRVTGASASLKGGTPY